MSWLRLPAPMRFLIVGIGNSSIGIATIFACVALGVNDIASNALGYGAGLVFSFFSNRSWTFGHAGPVWPTAWRFAAVFAISYASNLTLTAMMLRVWGSGSYLAQVAGIAPYTVLFYLGSKFFVFKPRPDGSVAKSINYIA